MKDILLQLTSYPTRTPRPVIDTAVELAGMFQARVTAAICRIEVPDPSNFLARKLANVSEAIAAENDKSIAAAHAMEAEFQAAAGGRGLVAETRLLHCRGMLQSTQLIHHARVHDLTIMPVSSETAIQFTAQDLIFGSGRPVLLVPQEATRKAAIGVAVVGWDGSRAAARALADARPFLQRAASVRLVMITGDKSIDPESNLNELRHHLKTHGIAAQMDTVPANGGSAGDALVRYCGEHGADLLVMGAYGHSRMRDFVVGGATKSIMAHTPLPVLLSH